MSAQRWAGVSGIAFVVLNVAIVGLYASGGIAPRPEDAQALTAYAAQNRSLLLTNFVVASLSFGFFTFWLLGLRALFRAAGAEHEAAGAMLFGVGLVNGAFTLGGSCFVAAAAIEAGAAQPEPLIVRALFQASFAVFAPSNLLTALFIAPAAYATFKSGALPRWTGFLGWVATAGNLAAVPSIFGGTDPSRFYSLAGPSGVVLSLFPFLLYTLVVGIAMVRRR